MKLPWGRIILAILIVAVLFAGAAFLAPEIDAGAIREPLKRALRETTGRNVEVGDIRYQVFPFLGVAATDIVIPDDPSFGLEPIAYVGELQAGLHWPSLLSGRFRLGSVRLVEASINLARTGNAGWNVPALLRNMVGHREVVPVPRVEIRAGRINFREGVEKSSFFLNEVDLDLDPPGSARDSLSWSYEASPARTDRSESGFGRFRGRGAWDPTASPEGRLEIDIELERSLASEVLTLVTGRDLGLQGRLSTRAQLDGPINDVRIKGNLRVENSGQQGFFGFSGPGWTLPYEGILDLTGQNFQVSTAPPRDGERLPLELKASCSRLMSQPHWSAAFGFDGLPASVLIDLARRFGVRAPDGLAVEGKVHGSIEYAQGEPVRGRVALREAAVGLNDAGPLTFSEATVAVAGSEMTLEPAMMMTPAGNEVELSGRWEIETEETEFRMRTQSIPLAALRSALNNLPNVPGLAAFEDCSNAELKGELRFERRSSSSESPPAWFGDLELQQARCSVAGGPDLAVDRATVALRGAHWSVRKAAGRWGNWPFQADIDYLPTAQRPFRVSLSLPRLEADDLDRFFRPALSRRMGFLERTFRSRASAPAWLAARRVEGTLHIDELVLANLDASGVTARYFWDGVKLDMPDFTAKVEGGRFSGRYQILLGGESVRSRLIGRADGLEFGEALFESEFDAAWQGFGPPLIDTLQAQGQVVARIVETHDQPFRTIQACADFDGRRGRDRLQLSCLEAFSPAESFTGAASRIDSKWALDFAGPRRQFRLLGGFSPMEWSLEPRAR